MFGQLRSQPINASYHTPGVMAEHASEWITRLSVAAVSALRRLQKADTGLANVKISAAAGEDES